MGDCFIGVDVGTGSARAGVFDARGGCSAQRSTTLRSSARRARSSSSRAAEIWAAVSDAVRGALDAAGVAAADVRGIGFDATCSLVVLGAGRRPAAGRSFR